LRVIDLSDSSGRKKSRASFSAQLRMSLLRLPQNLRNPMMLYFKIMSKWNFEAEFNAGSRHIAA